MHEKVGYKHQYACTICKQDLTKKKFSSDKAQAHMDSCERNKDLIKHVHKEKPYDPNDNKDFSCKLCDSMIHKAFGHVLNHIRAVHVEGNPNESFTIVTNNSQNNLVDDDFDNNADVAYLAQQQLDLNEPNDLICKACHKHFSSNSNLRRHLRIHVSR